MVHFPRPCESRSCNVGSAGKESYLFGFGLGFGNTVFVFFFLLGHYLHLWIPFSKFLFFFKLFLPHHSYRLLAGLRIGCGFLLIYLFIYLSFYLRHTIAAALAILVVIHVSDAFRRWIPVSHTSTSDQIEEFSWPSQVHVYGFFAAGPMVTKRFAMSEGPC